MDATTATAGTGGSPYTEGLPAGGADPVDQPLLGLVMLAQYHGVAANAAQLRHEAGCGDTPLGTPALLLAAKKLGLKAKVVQQPAGRLDRVSTAR